VTPNKTTPVPTDFGKRRVHAGGTQSGSGHWFTGEDGRKVNLDDYLGVQVNHLLSFNRIRHFFTFG
jgi:hypothetical protein